MDGMSATGAPSGFVRAQKTKELDAFPQTPRHHVPACQHFLDDLPYLAGPEIEALVEDFHAVKYLFLRQVRIADGGELHALVVDQIDRVVLLQPAIVDSLLVQRRPGVGRRERYLNRVRIDLLGEID